jgi:hypothetical protein
MNINLMGTPKFMITLPNVETNLSMPWTVWTIGVYAFVAYHTSYQTPRWNHSPQWCQPFPNIDKVIQWFHTRHPCPTKVVW